MTIKGGKTSKCTMKKLFKETSKNLQNIVDYGSICGL